MKKSKLKYIVCAFLIVFMVGLVTTFVNITVVSAAPSTSENKEYDEKLEYLKCGDNYLPAPIAPVTRVSILLLQIFLPLAIILIGSMDFLKAVIAADQEKIKKNQHQFLNRLKAGLIFFFIITGFKFIVSLVADNSDNVLDCVDCLISDKESCGEITKENPYLSNGYK